MIIMTFRIFFSILVFQIIHFDAQCALSSSTKDSSIVDSLNSVGYNYRLTDPETTLVYARRALTLSKEIKYTNGLAEAYRISGIAFSYLGKRDKAISCYLIALSSFKASKNLVGEAKIYNNIGNLYREIDYDKALEYYKKALSLAKILKDNELIAGHYLNIGIVYFSKADFKKSLEFTLKSHSIYKKLNHEVGIILALQTLGVVYNKTNQSDKAEKYLLEAFHRAKSSNLNSVMGSISLTLVSIYANKKDYEKADFYLTEGKKYAFIAKDPKIQSDLLKKSYQLERSRKNYKKALNYLQELYTQDSIELQNTITKKFGMFEEQSKFEAREKKNLIELEKAKTNRVILFASLIVLTLAILVILLLTLSVKKKAKTNKLLKKLNAEISLQKENLDTINHNLEEIINERTKDLKIKNTKLSEYSSHLSHQIRGPVATIKGLMLLQKEALIDDKEYIEEISKWINEIDTRIMNINSVLNNLSEPGLIPRSSKKENES